MNPRLFAEWLNGIARCPWLPKNITFHLEIDVSLQVRLEYRKSYESVLGGEGHRMMNRMVSLAELAGDSDDGRDALMRSLMASRAARNLQVWISVEPDLLQLAHEMRYVFARMRISAYVEGAEFQNALLSQLRFRYIHDNKQSFVIKSWSSETQNKFEWL